MLITAASCVVNTLLVWWINRSYKISIHAAGVGGATYILLIMRRQCGVALFAKLAGRRLGAGFTCGRILPMQLGRGRLRWALGVRHYCTMLSCCEHGT